MERNRNSHHVREQNINRYQSPQDEWPEFEILGKSKNAGDLTDRAQELSKSFGKNSVRIKLVTHAMGDFEHQLQIKRPKGYWD